MTFTDGRDRNEIRFQNWYLSYMTDILSYRYEEHTKNKLCVQIKI